MGWEIKTRRRKRDPSCSAHIRAHWADLNVIDDVTIGCGNGVRASGSDQRLSQRSMSAFSKPVEGDFRWDGTVVNPEVILTWTDCGVECQQRVPLTARPHHIALPHTVHRSFERARRGVAGVFR